MRSPGGKRVLVLLLVVLVLAGAAAGAYFLFLREDPSDPAVAGDRVTDAADRLSGRKAEVSLEISLERPGQEAPAPEEFSGEGIVDFEAARADVTYDFEELANAGGFFGHFDEFEARFTDQLVYIEVFNQGPPWLSIPIFRADHPDIDRFREVVLSSPLVLTEILRHLNEVSGTSTEVAAQVDLEALTGAESRLPDGYVELFQLIQLDGIDVTAELADNTVSSMSYRLEFKEANNDAVVTVDVELGNTSESLEELPPDADVQQLTNFL